MMDYFSLFNYQKPGNVYSTKLYFPFEDLEHFEMNSIFHEKIFSPFPLLDNSDLRQNKLICMSDKQYLSVSISQKRGWLYFPP